MANNNQRKECSYTPCTDFTAPRSRTRTTQLDCVCTNYIKLGVPVSPCTLGVQLPCHSRMLTTRWRTICSECHFRTPPVRLCTAARKTTRSAQLGCVCVYKVHQTCTAVVPCTPGVRFPDRSRMLTRTWQIILRKRHCCTPPVRICTAPRSCTRTAHLGYLYKTL